MKKLLSLFTAVAVVLTTLVGCTTIQNLTPQQVAQVGVVLTQTAQQGAVYAIQQDHKNAAYFQLANATIDTFVLGTDLSPASLQAALAKIPGATNQWVGLAVSAAVVAYDVSYSQYVTSNVNSNAVAVAWITAVETGFKQALAQTGTGGVKAGKPTVPYFLTDGKVDKAKITARVKARK